MDFAVGDPFIGYARDKSWRRLVDTDNDPTTTPVEERRFDRILLEGTPLFPCASRTVRDRLPWVQKALEHQFVVSGGRRAAF